MKELKFLGELTLLSTYKYTLLLLFKSSI